MKRCEFEDKTRLFFTAATFSLIIAIAGASGLNAQVRSIREIDRLASSRKAFADKNLEKAIAVANIADYDAPTQWKRIGSAEDMRRYGDENPVYTSALNWLLGKRLIYSEIYYTSPSGDWARYVSYVFRDDGSTALINDEMRTFNENCIARTRVYLNEKGRILRRQTRSFDLISKKPRRTKCDAGTATSIIVNAEKLPFFPLIFR